MMITTTTKKGAKTKARAGKRAAPGTSPRHPNVDRIRPLPAPNADGNFDALSYLRASIARDLVARRRAAGLTQQALAEKAKVRQETISRIESAKHTVTARVLNKLMRVLPK
jgi:ribosome-binding protein aMBF1 (putative translation factor)